MIIKPDDKLFLVTIPLPGHPYLYFGHPEANPDWMIDMISEVTLREIHNIFRGTSFDVEPYEETFLTSTEEEALDIVFKYFPELV